MTYECELVEQTARPTLVVRARAPMDRLPQVLGPAWGQIMAYAGKAGEAPTGPPFVAYHDMDMQNLDLEIGLPFAQALDGEGDVRPASLPAGTAVETVHVGPYDHIGDAYEALQAWLQEHGREPAGAPYEHYLNDPDEVPPGELRTRIVWPVA